MRFSRTSFPAVDWSRDPVVAATSQHSNIGLNPYAPPFHPALLTTGASTRGTDSGSTGDRPTTPDNQIRRGRDELTDTIMARIQLDRRRQAQREKERQARMDGEEGEGSCRGDKGRGPRSTDSPPPDVVSDAGIQQDGEEVENDREMIQASTGDADDRKVLDAIQEEDGDMDAVSEVLGSSSLRSSPSTSPRLRMIASHNDISLCAPQLVPTHPTSYTDEGAYDQIFLIDSGDVCQDILSDDEDEESDFDIIVKLPLTPSGVVTPPSSSPRASALSLDSGRLSGVVHVKAGRGADRFAIGTRASCAIPIRSPSPQQSSSTTSPRTAVPTVCVEAAESLTDSQSIATLWPAESAPSPNAYSRPASSVGLARSSSRSSFLSTPALGHSRISESSPRSLRADSPITRSSSTGIDTVADSVVIVTPPDSNPSLAAGGWRDDQSQQPMSARSPGFRPRNLSRIFTETESEGRYPSRPPVSTRNSFTVKRNYPSTWSSSRTRPQISPETRQSMHPAALLSTKRFRAPTPYFSPLTFPDESDRMLAFIEHCFLRHNDLYSTALAMHNRAFVHPPSYDNSDDIDYHLTRPIITTSIDRLADGMLQYTLRLWRWDGQVNHSDGKIRVQQYVTSEQLCEESASGYGVVPLHEAAARFAGLRQVLQDLSYVSLRWPEYQSDRMAVVMTNSYGYHFGETLMSRTRDTVMDPLVWASVCHRIVNNQPILAALPFNTCVTGKEMIALVKDVMQMRQAAMNPPYTSLFCPTPEIYNYHHRRQYDLGDNLPPFVELHPSTTVINGLAPALCLKSPVKA